MSLQTEQTKQTYWIKPIRPHLLEGTESIDLPASELLFFGIDIGWYFPGILNVDKLRDAMAKAFQRFPHAAGCLHFDKDREKWTLKVNEGQGVPLTVVPNTDAKSPFAPDFDHQRHVDLIDTHPMPYDRQIFHGLPILKYNLAIWPETNESFLTCAWFHISGDAITCTSIHKAISDAYQDIPLTITPTFATLFNPDPVLDPASLAEVQPTLRHLDAAFELGDVIGMAMEMVTTTQKVNITLTTDELRRVHVLANDTSTSWVSPLDALSGLMIHTLNRTSGKAPIRNMMQFVGTRGAKHIPGERYVPPTRSDVGNCIQVVCETLPESPSSIGELAALMRQGPQRVKDATFLQNVMGYYAQKQKQQLADSLFVFAPPEKFIGFNNTRNVGWLNPHFGFVDKVRFYKYDGYIENFFAFLPRNPIPLPNGKWDTDEGGVDIKLRLKTDVAPVFLKTLRQDLEELKTKIGQRDVPKRSKVSAKL